MKTLKNTSLLLTGLLICAPFSLQANTPPATPEAVERLENGAIIRYHAKYFSQYKAITARDLLRKIPGIAELVSDDTSGSTSKRGFGSDGDQILINSKRLSGKSNDINDTLERVQASQILWVDIIRGAVEGLDVRSEGLVVNIQLDRSGNENKGSGSWQVNNYFDAYGNSDPDAKFAYSNTLSDMRYQLGIEFGPYNNNSYKTRRETIATADGTVFEQRSETSPEDRDEWILTGALGYDFGNNATLNINGRIADKSWQLPRDIKVTRIPLDGSPISTDFVAIDANTEGLDWELGGDYEADFGTGQIKARFIYSREEENVDEQVRVYPASGSAFISAEEKNDELHTESIARVSYAWPVQKKQNLEAGIEVALNTLDKNIALRTVNNGVLTPVDLFNPDSEVEELRTEVFTTHFWRLTQKWTLESALNIETSEISQEGIDVSVTRNFTFVKPRVDVRYDFSNSQQLRLTIDRSVSQLDFENFISTFDNNDDEVDAGNPDLTPEKTWEYSVTYERQFAEELGRFEAKAFYKDISDHIDKVAVSEFTSAPGNIGDAKIYGLELTNSIRLSPLGLPDAALEVTYTHQESEVIDPFVGDKRHVNETPLHNISTKFRHDIPRWGLSYWTEVSWQSRETATEINHRQTSDQGLRVLLFTEKHLTEKTSLWMNIRAATDNLTERSRLVYDGNISDNNLQRREFRKDNYRKELIIGLRGVF